MAEGHQGEPMQSRAPRKIACIEGLRGVLALWVLFGHALAAAGLGAGWRGPFAVIAAGGHAVDVFIIISGFVIFYLIDTARETYGRFIWRRVLRLYPAYLVCLAAAALVLPLSVTTYANSPWPHGLNENRVMVALSGIAHFPEHLGLHLLMLHSLVPDSVLPYSSYAILGTAWSLSLEWQFYVLAPPLFFLLLRGPFTALAVIALACAAHFLIAGQEGMLPRHIPMFALGIASYYVWQSWSRSMPAWPLLVVAGAALAYLLTHTPAIVIWTAVFLAATQPTALFARPLLAILESPPLLAAGRWSYSVYLSHPVLLVLNVAVLRRIGAEHLGQWAFFGILLTLTVATTVAASALLYRYVEAPVIALGRRPRPVATAPTPVEPSRPA